MLAANGGRNYLLVAAMDFGTTYSSYAFSFRNKPNQFHTETCWVAGSMGLLSSKTSSCLLLDPSEKLDSFGFEAENKYTDLADEGKHKEWFLFRHFKLMLQNDVKLNRSTLLRDVGGKQLPAIKVFALSIECLKNHLLGSLKKQVPEIEMHDVIFVLTVPAIWDDKAKMFMRSAALEAGIDDDQLVLALEPEAASVWCRSVETEQHFPASEPGTKYMLVDIGGGTADLTVHEVDEEGRLKELHMASGGPWGGIEVDKAFEKFLTVLTGWEVMDRMLKEEIRDYLDIFRDFESKKRTITSTTSTPVVIRIPTSMKKIYDECKARDEVAKNKSKMVVRKEQCGEPSDWTFGEGKVTLVGDKLKISPHIIFQLFNGPINALIKHVRTMLDEPTLANVGTIMLVGGFSECELMQEAFNKAFPGKKIINPQGCGLAVLKGAVLYGHNPTSVSARIARYTYGRSLAVPFDPKIHPKSKRYRASDGKSYCKDVFCKAVEKGQVLPLNHCVSEDGRPVDDDQESIVYKICRSLNPNPRFVTDNDCQLLGEVEMPLPEGDLQEDKKVEQIMIFSDTEIKFKVKHPKTGKVFQASWDLL